MATLRDIRKRLKAIQSTKKITSAMKMVAAAKMRKVQDRMLNFRPYASRMGTVLTDLASVAEREKQVPRLPGSHQRGQVGVERCGVLGKRQDDLPVSRMDRL